MSTGGLGRPAIEALGVRLRDLRRDAGMTGRQLATACGWAPSKITKIEYGRQTPSESDVRDWCIACGFPSDIPEMIAVLRTIDAQLVDWRRSLKSGTGLRQRANIDAYEKTTLFRVWEPSVVPGLIQTAKYARGILRTVIEFHGVPDDVEEGVRARTEAQRVLVRGDRRFLLLIGQAALYTAVGDATIMRGQLQRLREVSTMPRITLGIVPLTAPYTVPRNNAFTLYDDRLVTVATYTAELTLVQRHEIAIYASAFDRLLRLAKRGDAARALIDAALNNLEEI